VKSSKATASNSFACGSEEEFCRTIVGNRTFGNKELGPDMKSMFNAWVGRECPSNRILGPNSDHSKRIQDYGNFVVTRCIKRAFMTTMTGCFGLAPHDAKVGDLVCTVYSAEVVYIFREPEPNDADVPGSFIGEAYVHGIMQGEYIETAKSDDFTGFWLK
jgi:hypothetical protein